MKNIFIILFLLISQIQCIYSQKSDGIYPYCTEGKWGFVNKEKEIIVQPKFDEAYLQRDGMSRVKIDGKFGFINEKGKVSIKPKYDHAEDFDRGFALVKKGEYSFHIKVNGMIAKPKKETILYSMCGTHKSCMYPRITDRITIITKNNKLGIVYKKAIRQNDQTLIYVLDTIPPIFDTIVPITHQLMYFVRDGLISFAHEGSFHGGPEFILSRLNFEYEAIKLFDCNLCSHGKNEIIGFKKNGLWGYKGIHTIPKDHIPAKYYAISSLAKGLAFIEYEKGKFGYIDDKGNEFFPW